MFGPLSAEAFVLPRLCTARPAGLPGGGWDPGAMGPARFRF